MFDKKTYHREWYQKYGKAKEAEARVKIKTEVLTHYGNGRLACVHCGESRLACLSLDHIEGDGCKLRKWHNKYGYRYYIFLRRQGYPNGFQTLCMNCQFVKVVMDRTKQKEMPK